MQGRVVEWQDKEYLPGPVMEKLGASAYGEE